MVLRRTNAQNFFATIGHQWEDVRRSLLVMPITPHVIVSSSFRLTIVDMGCGTGDALEALAPFAKRLIGVINRQRCLHWQRRLRYCNKNQYCDGNIVDIDIQGKSMLFYQY